VVRIVPVDGQDVPAEGPEQVTNVPRAPVAPTLPAPGKHGRQGQVEGADEDRALQHGC
jgi:hypothetical protein